MPLDVQPLSRTRRALLLGSLLAIFAGSMAFAEALVLRQQAVPPVAWNVAPLGFTAVEPTASDGEIEARSGLIAGHHREVRLFAFPFEGPQTLQTEVHAAQDLFEDVSDAPVEERDMSTLAGVSAIQLGGISSDGNFTIMRFTTHAGHAVAISYSGPTPYTDADKKLFSTLCAAGIRLNR